MFIIMIFLEFKKTLFRKLIQIQDTQSEILKQLSSSSRITSHAEPELNFQSIPNLPTNNQADLKDLETYLAEEDNFTLFVSKCNQK